MTTNSQSINDLNESLRSLINNPNEAAKDEIQAVSQAEQNQQQSLAVGDTAVNSPDDASNTNVLDDTVKLIINSYQTVLNTSEETDQIFFDSVCRLTKKPELIGVALSIVNLNKWTREVENKNKEEFKTMYTKLNNIIEKNNCWRVRFLDWLADSIDARAAKMSTALKARAAKINTPCIIKFKK